MSDIHLSLIIPAYNEEARLLDSLQKIADFVGSQNYSSEVLIVENGSTDDSFAIAEEFCESRPTFSVHHMSAKGKGLAVRWGMLAAKGAYRMMLDADLSMPVDQINRFLPPQLDPMDISIASREALGAIRYNEPNYRHIGGRLMNAIIRQLAIPGLQDTQCGFKCFRAEVAEDLFLNQKMSGWSFDVELLFIAQLRGYSISELPIPWYYREQSHVRPIPDSLQMIFDLFKIRRNASQGSYGKAN
jgi:glycosyltransferase involved in cell wall biosynthesis